jgi:hypothetical protein
VRHSWGVDPKFKFGNLQKKLAIMRGRQFVIGEIGVLKNSTPSAGNQQKIDTMQIEVFQPGVLYGRKPRKYK